MHERIAGNDDLAKLVARCREPSIGELAPSDGERIQSYANAVANTYVSFELAHQSGQLNRDVYVTYCHDFIRFNAMYPGLAPKLRSMLEQNPLAQHYEIFRPLFDERES